MRGKKEVNALREKIEAKCENEEMKAFALDLLKWFAGGKEPRVNPKKA